MKATKSSSTERVLPPKGNHLAIISQIIDWGTVKDSFGSRRKVEFISELPEHTHVFNEDDGEMPIIIDRKFANNLGSAKRPSGLREFIEAITGEEVEGDEYELEDLLGVGYRVNIVIKNDGEYKNAVHKAYTMLSPAENKKLPKIQGASFVFDLDNFDQEVFDSLPTWKQGEIAKSPEYKALGLKPVKSQGRAEDNDDEDEDETPAPKRSAKPAPKKGGSAKGKKLL